MTEKKTELNSQSEDHKRMTNLVGEIVETLRSGGCSDENLIGFFCDCLDRVWREHHKKVVKNAITYNNEDDNLLYDMAYAAFCESAEQLLNNGNTVMRELIQSWYKLSKVDILATILYPYALRMGGKNLLQEYKEILVSLQKETEKDEYDPFNDIIPADNGRLFINLLVENIDMGKRELGHFFEHAGAIKKSGAIMADIERRHQKKNLNKKDGKKTAENE